MNAGQAQLRRREGFTLIEIAVVLAILAVVTAFAVPALRLPHDEPHSPSAGVLAVVRSTRAEAVRRGETLELIIDERSDRYWIFDAEKVEMASGRFGFGESVRWSATERRLRLRFTHVGAIEGEGLSLVHPDGRLEHLEWSRWSGRPVASDRPLHFHGDSRGKR